MNAISKPTILVADTDPTALAQVVRVLSRDDFNVFSAICHSSALSAAQKLNLDLVICDLSLWMGVPRRDLIADIHRIPDRADVPVIFTSAGQQTNVIRRQHDFGGAFHLKKPIDPVVLIELVERALWMPHLVKTHIRRPHFSVAPPISTVSMVTLPNESSV